MPTELAKQSQRVFVYLLPSSQVLILDIIDNLMFYLSVNFSALLSSVVTSSLFLQQK